MEAETTKKGKDLSIEILAEQAKERENYVRNNIRSVMNCIKDETASIDRLTTELNKRKERLAKIEAMGVEEAYAFICAENKECVDKMWYVASNTYNFTTN